MVRIVLDVNVVISGLLRPQGKPGHLLRLWQAGRFELLYSPALLDELIAVVIRPRLQKIGLRSEDARVVMDYVTEFGVLILPLERVNACRDPKDNHILDIALTGRADAVVSGDADLLVLHPFQKIPVLTPADFLASLSS